MDPNNQKGYPSLGPQPVHPSQMQPGVYPQMGGVQPPQGVYPQQPPIGVITQQPTTTVIVQPARFGADSQTMTCPSCRASIATSVKYEPALKTHLIAGCICLLFWPCVCLPYCIDSCKNANHSCPNCGAYLGSQD